MIDTPLPSLRAWTQAFTDAEIPVLPGSVAELNQLKAIEEAIPGSGKGEQKLSAIRGILEAVDGSITSLWPQISSVISVLVTLFNNTGIFKKA